MFLSWCSGNESNEQPKGCWVDHRPRSGDVALKNKKKKKNSTLMKRDVQSGPDQDCSVFASLTANLLSLPGFVWPRDLPAPWLFYTFHHCLSWPGFWALVDYPSVILLTIFCPATLPSDWQTLPYYKKIPVLWVVKNVCDFFFLPHASSRSLETLWITYIKPWHIFKQPSRQMVIISF